MNPATPSSEAPLEPRVSVIIVTWNCAQAARRCLTALDASKERDRLEVFLVDLGSRDASSQMDAEFANITALRLPRNFGRTRARNIALRSASANLVLFLSPDVEVRPETIPRLADALEAREDATAAAPLIETPEGALVEVAVKLPPLDQLKQCCRAGIPLPAAPQGETPEAVRDFALMIRRPFLQGMNYLDEKRYSHHWAELEICWQIRNAGKRILLVGNAAATLHPPAPGPRLDTAARALETSDRICGAASWISKHLGFRAGASFYLGFVMSALGGLISFREPSYHFSLLSNLAMGSRIDGTQGGILG